MIKELCLLYLNFAFLFVCKIKRQNGWTDQAQNFVGPHDPRKVSWLGKMKKNALKNLDFFKSTKQIAKRATIIS